MSKQYSLKFVNEGKSFDMPVWTVAKHELLLEMMIPLDEKLRLKVIKQSDYDKAYRIQMMLLTMHELDLKVTENDLKSMHPDDFIELWSAVYNSGKSGIEVNPQDFQKGV